MHGRQDVLIKGRVNQLRRRRPVLFDEKGKAIVRRGGRRPRGAKKKRGDQSFTSQSFTSQPPGSLAKAHAELEARRQVPTSLLSYGYWQWLVYATWRIGDTSGSEG